MAGKPVYSFKSMVHMQPPMILREVSPSELRAWEVKFDNWLKCSLQGVAPPDFAVNTFLSLVDSWWLNRLLPKQKDNSSLSDLRLVVCEKMEVLFP